VITETSEETDSQNSHIWQGTIETEGDKDIREELFYLLAEAKCPLLEMTQTKLSLEDIFLELTEDDNTEKEEA
jgi:ABC-2 type transport system ATP-binding protein